MKNSEMWNINLIKWENLQLLLELKEGLHKKAVHEKSFPTHKFHTKNQYLSNLKKIKNHILGPFYPILGTLEFFKKSKPQY